MNTIVKASGIAAIGFLVCVAASAAPPGKHPPPGHPAPPPHPAAHIAAPHIAARPMVAHAQRHVAAPRVAHIRPAHVNVAHGPATHVHTHAAHLHTPTVNTNAHLNTPNAQHGRHNANVNTNANINANLHNAHNNRLARVNSGADPRNFAAHRRFSHVAALRPFLAARWHRDHHLGWVGPVFWPYAYGDFFYDALWPGDYQDYDPFWAYGYGDIYEGIFSPYDYDSYVRGRGAPARMAALQQTVTQSCTDEASEVTGWPIDQIKAAVQPDPRQNVFLDNLGNAIVKASDLIKSHCPATVSFTPTGRLAEMQQRLEGLVQAVNVVQPALAKFYDSLTDEQKARFDDMGAPQGSQPQSGKPAANPQAQCGQNVMTWPTEQVDRVLQPNDAQRAKLQALDAAAAQAADVVKAACPSQTASTPPGRLAAEGKRLQAMLQAVEAIRPKLEDFYNSLSDSQKAGFNNLGRRVFAQK